MIVNMIKRNQWSLIVMKQNDKANEFPLWC